MSAVSTAPGTTDLADRDAFLTLAREHYENFPVGSWLLPKRARLHLARIYAFARTADDLADEHRDLAALLRFRELFLESLEGRPEDAPRLFADLRLTIEECELPRQLFLDLLDAFEQDLRKNRYANQDELRDYCRRSADPVGRLVLRVHGIVDEETDRLSDHVCTGLQIVNHVQDLADDLRERDRLYFPAADLELLGIAEDDLRSASYPDGARILVRQWAEHAAWSLHEGAPIVERVRGRLRYELKAVIATAAAQIDALRAVEFDVGPGRIKASKAARLRAALAWIALGRFPRALRKGGIRW
ncbi:MAG: squalene synthase HpnC [Planctomycetota bacterium]